MINLGVGVFVFRDNKFLLGKRSDKCKRGPGVWALPGGNLENNETIAECAVREVKEETGLDVEVTRIGDFMDCVLGVSHILTRTPPINHLAMWVGAKCVDSEQPRVMEPDKCVEWRWVTYQDLLTLTPQDGEQVYWIPHEAITKMLHRIGYFKTSPY